MSIKHANSSLMPVLLGSMKDRGDSVIFADPYWLLRPRLDLAQLAKQPKLRVPSHRPQSYGRCLTSKWHGGCHRPAKHSNNATQNVSHSRKPESASVNGGAAERLAARDGDLKTSGRTDDVPCALPVPGTGKAADFGGVGDPLPLNKQSHQLFDRCRP